MTIRAVPYFANADAKEIGSKICSRIKDIGDASLSQQAQERREKYATAYWQHYGFEMGFGSTSETSRKGSQGELAQSRNNKARTNVKAHVGLLLGPKFTWRPQAAASKTSARAAVTLCSNILEWYWRQRRMMNFVSELVEIADVFSEGFIHAPWEQRGGPELPIGDGGAPRGAGDIQFYSVLPWHVFRDDSRSNFRNLDWVCVVNPDANAYDLEALYPQTITGEPTKDRLSGMSPPDFFDNGNSWRNKQSDTVALCHFYHKPTPALPSGRQVTFLSSECVLEDGPLLYDSIPLIRYAADEQFGTPYGYTSHWDALGQQEVLDNLHSAVVTNQTALAAQGLVLEEGTKFDGEEVNGMKVFYYPRGGSAPAPLQLTATPKEVFEHMDTIKADMRDILGMNDFSMGQPQTAQMNAEAFAILKSSAIERNSPAQQRLLDAVSELGTHVIKTIRKFVGEGMPRNVPTAAIQEAVTAEASYVGKDLDAIDSVFVTVGNPLEQTPAGRFQLTQFYLNAGLIKDPEQIQQVVETGRLEPVTNPMRKSDLYIDKENEQLQKGERPPVALTDDVFKHVLTHKCVLDDPQTRTNPQVLEAAIAHINEHIRVYLGVPEGADVTMDPRYMPILRGALGQQPPPPDPATAPPPGEEGGAPAPAPGAQPNSGPPPAQENQPASVLQTPQAGGPPTSTETALLPA